jgi:uncharacterized membrane protein (DUF4010 family)
MDVDAATLTAARLTDASISMPSAGQTILLAVAVNAAMRIVYAGTAGPSLTPCDLPRSRSQP